MTTIFLHYSFAQGVRFVQRFSIRASHSEKHDLPFSVTKLMDKISAIDEFGIGTVTGKLLRALTPRKKIALCLDAYKREQKQLYPKIAQIMCGTDVAFFLNYIKNTKMDWDESVALRHVCLEILKHIPAISQYDIKIIFMELASGKDQIDYDILKILTQRVIEHAQSDYANLPLLALRVRLQDFYQHVPTYEKNKFEAILMYFDGVYHTMISIPSEILT